MLRFAPQNSWPDNRGLDKARRLLWPVKKKYGRKISWADLMIFAGNVALETMGFTTFGFARRPGRRLGARRGRLLGSRARLARRRAPQPRPRAGEPAGRRPDGPDLRQPRGSARRARTRSWPGRDIRETHRRMGMDDEETVALIVGGHTFGKTHGAAAGDAISASNPKAPRSRSRAWAGGAASAPASARTRSPAASRAPGRPPRRGGTTASWRPCSATSGTRC